MLKYNRLAMSLGANGRLRFGDYEVDSHAGKLSRDGLPVKIQPQPFRVLSILLEQPGEIVSREQLRERVWGNATFVEFDQGLNYCIRQVRRALHDGASEPVYIETLPKQGYRFIAPVSGSMPAQPAAGLPPISSPVISSRINRKWIFAAVGAILVIACTSLYAFFYVRPGLVRYTQLTDFTDSATAPALSPDGRMIAFIRGDRGFLTADQIWVKILPTGEARLLTDDPRRKYGLAFSPDGSQVAYTALDGQNYFTFTVPVLGGDSRLFMENAAGLTWLDPNRILFSAIRSGVHMGVVTGTAARSDLHDLYFPAHERAMAHYSYASPDRKRALVVQMDEQGGWAQCAIISLDASSAPKNAGPNGACTSAGWSPDGALMYFTAQVAGQSHLWRQRFPNGSPEQITSGPDEEEGIVVEPNDRSIITSVGTHESSLWIHDEHGDRLLSSEGEIANTSTNPPSFSPDGKTLYYLLRRPAANAGAELWRVNVESGVGEAVLPGAAMVSYDISPDGRQVVYQTEDRGASQLWLAPVSRDVPARRIANSGQNTPKFGPNGEIFFRFSEGNFNYLGRMNPDGSGRSKVFQVPANEFRAISPGKRWVVVAAKRADGRGDGEFAFPVDGGPPVLLCSTLCRPTWSPNGNFLYIPVELASRKSPGRSLAIPMGPGETLPKFPPGGIEPGSDASVIPGAQIVDRAELAPSPDPSRYAYVNSTMHRNLYRVSLP
jgi:DNA-binding winged helix-turn-helix (wHTH) protein/Tol biopolymer transport system component